MSQQTIQRPSYAGPQSMVYNSTPNAVPYAQANDLSLTQSISPLTVSQTGSPTAFPFSQTGTTTTTYLSQTTPTSSFSAPQATASQFSSVPLTSGSTFTTAPAAGAYSPTIAPVPMLNAPYYSQHGTSLVQPTGGFVQQAGGAPGFVQQAGGTPTLLQSGQQQTVPVPPPSDALNPDLELKKRMLDKHRDLKMKEAEMETNKEKKLEEKAEKQREKAVKWTAKGMPKMSLRHEKKADKLELAAHEHHMKSEQYKLDAKTLETERKQYEPPKEEKKSSTTKTTSSSSSKPTARPSGSSTTRTETKTPQQPPNNSTVKPPSQQPQAPRPQQQVEKVEETKTYEKKAEPEPWINNASNTSTTGVGSS